MQLKRWGVKYPSILAVMLITVAVAALLVFFVLGESRSDEDVVRVRIGIVGDVHDSYLGVGVYALQNLDSSRYAVDFEQMDEESAEKALRAGEISGYVNIPDDFIKGILKGQNTPAQYYIRKGAANFGTIIISEIASTVSDLVTQSQTAIYSMQDVARAYGRKQGLSNKTKMLNLMYIDYILNRTNMFESEVGGIADGLSLGGYYLCAVAVLMLMLWGISCCSILSDRKYALSRMLFSHSVGAFRQIAGEYAAFLTVTVLTFFAFCTAAVMMPESVKLAVRELGGTGIGDAFAFTFKMLPVILMITSMHIAVYEIAGNTVSAVLAEFVLAFALGYISGCFYPLYFFPEALQSIAQWLPCGAGFEYARKILGNGNVLSDMLICLSYFVAFAGAAVAVRRLKMAGDRG